ncbi:uncharacterized protein LOC112683342 [Sipha flava]|uniref:Uncharacterized protein LOC112683342 n=1 Tax=Sipha flava TaxID=143950 RepID=A0A8B8FHC8_9HEMI|nr:uncharacterized protein LOC112683342 [Sipha flava]
MVKDIFKFHSTFDPAIVTCILFYNPNKTKYDLDILGESLTDVANATKILSSEAKKIGLHISEDKTKIMELLESDEDPRVTEDLMYEKVENFKYLGATLSTKNYWSKCLSRKTKIRLYTAIIRPTLTYGCKAWTSTKQTEKS